MPVAEAKVLVGGPQGVPGGDDVEDGELGDRPRVVQGHAVGDARAPVVARHGEALEAEFAHHQDLVVGHRALGVGVMGGAAGRLAAVAVTAQVGEDDHVVLGQDGGDVVPHDVGLRVAVQQQDGGARFVAAYQGVDPYPARGKRDSLEQVGQRNSHMTPFPRSRSDVISRQP